MINVNKNVLLLYSVICCVSLNSLIAQQSTESALWGDEGERWSGPEGRLPDWSYAGYKGYEAYPPEIPDVPIWQDITQAPYHADNTGSRDISDIIIRAIQDYPADSTPGALYFPAGTYKISQYIKIRKSNIVLRGDGMGKTVLRFTRGILACDFNLLESYTGPGMIHFTGGDFNVDELQGKTILEPAHEKVGAVTKSLKRGEQIIPVSSASGFEAGDWVMFQWDLEQGDQESDIHALEYNKDLWNEFVNNGAIEQMNPKQQHPYKYWKPGLFIWFAKIESTEENRIILNRGLPFRTKPKEGAFGWNTNVRKVNMRTFLTGVGVEDMTIDFPDFVTQKNRKGALGFWHNEKTYFDVNGVRYDAPGPGRRLFHDFRDGHSAIALYSTLDSWIRRVEFIDCDGPVILSNARYTTVRDLKVRRVDKRGAPMGHFGVRMSHYCHDVLLEDIAFEGADYVHDISTQLSLNCVYSRCTGTNDFECDMHGHVYGCLFTEIHSTQGNIHAGNAKMKPNGAFNTFWNIRTEDGGYTNWRGKYYGMRYLSGNLIGIDSDSLRTTKSDVTGRDSKLWVEKWIGPDSVPVNIFRSQRARRIADRPR